MAPLDAVGTDVVGSVRAVNRSLPGAAIAAGFTSPPGGSPLDEFLRQERAARAGPKQNLAVTAVDEPRFGRIAFSAGVGDVLIQLQAERPAEADTSARETRRAFATYALAQSLREAPGQGLGAERHMRGATIEIAGFWGQPKLINLLPMMV